MLDLDFHGTFIFGLVPKRRRTKLAQPQFYLYFWTMHSAAVRNNIVRFKAMNLISFWAILKVVCGCDEKNFMRLFNESINFVIFSSFFSLNQSLNWNQPFFILKFCISIRNLLIKLWFMNPFYSQVSDTLLVELKVDLIMWRSTTMDQSVCFMSRGNGMCISMRLACHWVIWTKVIASFWMLVTIFTSTLGPRPVAMRS